VLLRVYIQLGTNSGSLVNVKLGCLNPSTPSALQKDSVNDFFLKSFPSLLSLLLTHFSLLDDIDTRHLEKLRITIIRNHPLLVLLTLPSLFLLSIFHKSPADEDNTQGTGRRVRSLMLHSRFHQGFLQQTCFGGPTTT
jgi:hypothetical protein